MINIENPVMGMHREQAVATDGYAMALIWPRQCCFPLLQSIPLAPPVLPHFQIDAFIRGPAKLQDISIVNSHRLLMCVTILQVDKTRRH
jgi:hypothetical protein